MYNLKTSYDETTKVWSGVKMPRTYQTSVGKAVLTTLLENPTNVAQICYPSGKTYTNLELAALSISVAHHFTKLGLQQCDIIGICASNTDFVAPLVFGAMFKGLTISTLDVSIKKDGIQHAFGMTKPKMMFCDGGVYNKVAEALQEIGLNMPIYTMKEHIAGKPSINEFLNNTTASLDYNFEPLKLGLVQTAAILFSSGTTGLPKGVTISNEDVLEFQFFELPAGERYLCFSPLHWITSVAVVFYTTFSVLTRIISDRPYSTADFYDIAAKYRPTILLTPPSQMAMILAAPQIKSTDLSFIKLYYCGGSTVSYAVGKELQQYMPKAQFFNNYGMTELRNILGAGALLDGHGLIGSLMPNIQIIIMADDGRRLGPNEIGEICVKSPRKWLGYYDNEKATAAAHDAEGWFSSGDLAYIDEHNQLYLVDRKKNILKYKGFQYYPMEIERVINELKDVLDVCVCGLPDLMSSDLPAAAVVKKTGSDLTEQAIYEHVSERMDHFKQLRGGIYFLDKMPLSATGKVLRVEVQNICKKLRNERS